MKLFLLNAMLLESTYLFAFFERKKKKKKNDVIECLDFVKVTGEICSW